MVGKAKIYLFLYARVIAILLRIRVFIDSVFGGQREDSFREDAVNQADTYHLAT